MSSSNSFGPDLDIEISNGCFPFGFWRELVELFHLAWPTSLSILFHYLIQPISLMFCGHLGKEQLASAALAISFIYISTVSIGRGLAFGGDTFFSQVYGSANKKQVGVYLQRSLIFGFLCCFPIWAILLNAEKIFLLIGQNSQISSKAQEYCLYFMPGALAYCWLFTLMRYLLCQNRVLPNLLICMGSCGVNAILHYGLVYQAEMGLKGSAISLALTYYLVLTLLISYIWGSGIYRETWAGWTWESLEEWGDFGRVAVSSIFMTFIFWLCTEVGTFLCGLLGEKDMVEKAISAFQIGFQVEGFAWMYKAGIPLGIGSGCTARIGQYLGANQPLGAITSCRVAFTVTVFISLALAGACYGLRFIIPLAFSSDKNIIDYTANIMSIVAIFLLLEGFGGVGVGIVRGTGRQTLGVVIIFISYYLVALPVGIPLMFATSLGLSGLWWGYVLGLGVQDLFLMGFVGKLNWQQEAEKAQERAGLVQTNSEESTINGVGSPEEQSTESTALLGSTSSNIRQRNLKSLIIKRLAILLIFVIVLAVGFLVRFFVPVHSPMTDLCIPHFNASTSTPLPIFNSSLPFCNFTEVEGVWPYYPLHV